MKQFIPDTLTILGTDAEGKIAIWSRDTKQLHILATNELTRAKLVHLAGHDACLRVAEKLPKGVKAENIIPDAIADYARHIPINTTNRIGQGVWRIPNHGTLLVSGSKSIVIDLVANQVNIRELEEPIIANRLIAISDKPWIEPQTLFSSTGTALEAWEQLVQGLSCWKFKDDKDQLVIAGMIAATCIQQALDFRPQVWVTGPSNCGKTALKHYIKGLYPWSIDSENETSEAAIRQSIRHDSLPILMDEQEGWAGRDRLIKLLRSSTRGGVIRKGSHLVKPSSSRCSTYAGYSL